MTAIQRYGVLTTYAVVTSQLRKSSRTASQKRLRLRRELRLGRRALAVSEVCLAEALTCEGGPLFILLLLQICIVSSREAVLPTERPCLSSLNSRSAKRCLSIAHEWSGEAIRLHPAKPPQSARHYVGIASDPRERLDWHNGGPCGYTRAHRPWVIAVSLEFPTEQQALRFERYRRIGPGIREAPLCRGYVARGVTVLLMQNPPPRTA